MEECCPDLANSQHREDMSKAPSSLTIRSVVSAVFGGRWACAHLAAHAGVKRTRAAAHEDSKPASAINSFKLLCTTPLFLTGTVPASTSPLYAPYFWLSLFSDELLQTFDMLDDTTLHLSPAVGDPSDSLNRRARG